MRTYEWTNAWITFRLDLRSVDAELWMLLGEARSKCEHLAGVPLRPETARELDQVNLAKGVLATTAIEGNTLSEQQVRLQLEGKLELPPSQEYLAREVQNIVDACNAIWEGVLAGAPRPRGAAPDGPGRNDRRRPLARPHRDHRRVHARPPPALRCREATPPVSGRGGPVVG